MKLTLTMEYSGDKYSGNTPSDAAYMLHQYALGALDLMPTDMLEGESRQIPVFDGNHNRIGTLALEA